jgi:hypothetical protein
MASAQKWLDHLADTLARGKQRRSREAIERDIQTRLMGRQHLELAPIPWTPGLCRQRTIAQVSFGLVRGSVAVV